MDRQEDITASASEVDEPGTVEESGESSAASRLHNEEDEERAMSTAEGVLSIPAEVISTSASADSGEAPVVFLHFFA